ncbi:MAG TPA: penicillin-binding transpeptidase domain-containing protein [Candidatus Acidoferrales bacterium]|nr:penicillin-binding transpeptidase domain-containing protein [Candidatus Acidoferrales bacterium]
MRSAVSLLCLFIAGAFALVCAGAPARRVRHARRVHRAPQPYDPAKADVIGNDDPVIRELAIQALGHEKGSVLAMDPNTGRILTIVNQKLAFSAGFEPCSTTKPIIAIAGLQEGVIKDDTMLRVGYRRYMDLTEALAHSNNQFFEDVGAKLGFDRVMKYERLFGLGERTSTNIPDEQPGSLPTRPPLWGGVARMSSFGEGIRITPFQLALVVSTLANGGTEYWLQYPRTEQEVADFQPRVRRQLDIAPLLPQLREGMLAAVLYGTAKRSFDPADGEEEFGKTGTCNDERVGGRLGWFVSYADQAHPKIVIVVLLHGGARIISGPHASEIAGRIYHGLYEHNYFADVGRTEPTYASSADNSSR